VVGLATQEVRLLLDHILEEVRQNERCTLVLMLGLVESILQGEVFFLERFVLLAPLDDVLLVLLELCLEVVDELLRGAKLFLLVATSILALTHGAASLQH
jgi:hypothetical protein